MCIRDRPDCLTWLASTLQVIKVAQTRVSTAASGGGGISSFPLDVKHNPPVSAVAAADLALLIVLAVTAAELALLMTDIAPCSGNLRKYGHGETVVDGY